jgi:hypothetical protein
MALRATLACDLASGHFGADRVDGQERLMAGH